MAESKRFLLRLDPRVFDALRRWAQDDLRSINGQIEYLLTQQVPRAGRRPQKPVRPPAANPEAATTRMSRSTPTSASLRAAAERPPHNRRTNRCIYAQRGESGTAVTGT